MKESRGEALTLTECNLEPDKFRPLYAPSKRGLSPSYAVVRTPSAQIFTTTAAVRKSWIERKKTPPDFRVMENFQSLPSFPTLSRPHKPILVWCPMIQRK